MEGLQRTEDDPWVIHGPASGLSTSPIRSTPGGASVPAPGSTISASTICVTIRIHDLRHPFASGGLLVGEGLPMIGKPLGHTQVQTTARYAHLANDPVKSAANRIASRIAEVTG